MKRPAIILIFAHKPQLEWYEDISLRQCLRVLHKHPMRLVCPEGLDVSAYKRIAPTIEIDSIPPHWLASLHTYNRLKMSPWLYRRYAEFEYMLTYELDAFVFRDELLDWCAQDLDYIGAPWFEGFNNAKPDAAYLGVGNSGFSLRRVKTMLRISTTWKCVEPCRVVWDRSFASRLHPLGEMRYFAEAILFNNFHFPFCPKVLEDYHWCIHVPKAFPEFRVAPIADAVRFAFEANPARLFKEWGEKLPFGCHKWMHYNPEFWFSRIRDCGYEF